MNCLQSFNQESLEGESLGHLKHSMLRAAYSADSCAPSEKRTFYFLDKSCERGDLVHWGYE